MRKKLLALVMVLGLLGSAVPVLAAEEPAVQPVPAWAYGVLADGYAMGLFGDDIYTSHSQPVTQEQVDALAQCNCFVQLAYLTLKICTKRQLHYSFTS